MIVNHILLGMFLLIPSLIFANEPLKIGVITDTHYLSEQLMDNGYALDEYIYVSGKNVRYIPDVLSQVLDDYLQSDIHVLLVCGDITNDGEKQSHLDFIKKLKPLQEKGVKVFVIPGNHDVNVPNTIAFRGNKRFPTDNISPADFAELYSECGYGNAISRDAASLSYAAELNSDTWLLAIDAARYDEYTNSSITSGRVLPETEKWALDILNEAKLQNKQVIGMMHWGLTEHIMYQSLFFKEYLVDDWKRLANLFADNGMKVIFTGHFHANDITAFHSDKGNVIYDVETGTLSAYPFSYRFVTLDADGMGVETRNIVSIPENPDFAEKDKQRMLALSTRLAKLKLKALDYNFSDDILSAFADVLGQIFIKHAYGDEKVDDQLKQTMVKLASMLETPIDTDDIELDFPPADNNVNIKFD